MKSLVFQQGIAKPSGGRERFGICRATLATNQVLQAALAKVNSAMFGISEAVEESFSIVKDCLRMLRKDPELVLFPLFSGSATSLVTVAFALSLRQTPYVEVLKRNPTSSQIVEDPVALAILLAYYFLNCFIISFFNAALIACVVVRVHGADPGVKTGLRFAVNRFPQIAGWSLLCATVGVIIRLLELEKRCGRRLVAALFGMAWSLATYFVVPAMVIEKVGPIAAIRKSIAVMIDTWGVQLVAGIGLGPIQFIAFCLALSPLLVAQWFDQPTVQWFCVGLSVALLFPTVLICSTFDSIFRAALYLYASEGRIADGFDEAHLGNAIRAVE